MKIIIRLFFRSLRALLGPLMLLWESVTRPKGLVRPPALQKKVDLQCQNLVLYQYQTCPFCIKVRQEVRRLSLNLERRDAQPAGQHRDDLMAGCGKAKVPCLKITDVSGSSQWLTDSTAIIAYLRSRFAND